MVGEQLVSFPTETLIMAKTSTVNGKTPELVRPCYRIDFADGRERLTLRASTFCFGPDWVTFYGTGTEVIAIYPRERIAGVCKFP